LNDWNEKTHLSTNFTFVAGSGDCINITSASIQLGIHIGYLGWGIKIGFGISTTETRLALHQLESPHSLSELLSVVYVFYSVIKC